MSVFLSDYVANKGNIKSLFIVVSFRIANYFATKNIIYKFIGLPFRVFHRFFVEWILGVEIPEKTKIGAGLRVYHGQGLVIHSSSIIGENVVIRHGTTIGAMEGSNKAPVIGNNVNIGVNSIIIGQIEIGDNVIVGAGSVVLKSFKSNCVIVGNPAKIIRMQEEY